MSIMAFDDSKICGPAKERLWRGQNCSCANKNVPEASSGNGDGDCESQKSAAGHLFKRNVQVTSLEIFHDTEKPLRSIMMSTSQGHSMLACCRRGKVQAFDLRSLTFRRGDSLRSEAEPRSHSGICCQCFCGGDCRLKVCNNRGVVPCIFLRRIPSTVACKFRYRVFRKNCCLDRYSLLTEDRGWNGGGGLRETQGHEQQRKALKDSRNRRFI